MVKFRLHLDLFSHLSFPTSSLLHKETQMCKIPLKNVIFVAVTLIHQSSLYKTGF